MWLEAALVVYNETSFTSSSSVYKPHSRFTKPGPLKLRFALSRPGFSPHEDSWDPDRVGVNPSKGLSEVTEISAHTYRRRTEVMWNFHFIQ